MIRTIGNVGLGVLVLAVAACAPKVEAPAGPVRIENVELGVAVADLPAGAEVKVNSGSALEIVLPQPGGSPTNCRTEVGPEVRGVNLVEEVGFHKEQFLALEQGEVVGTTELQGPLGPAYLARGRFQRDGARVEEMRAITLHPSGKRTLVLYCSYPFGGSDDIEAAKARFGAVVGLLGELEGISEAPAS